MFFRKHNLVVWLRFLFFNGWKSGFAIIYYAYCLVIVCCIYSIVDAMGYTTYAIRNTKQEQVGEQGANEFGVGKKHKAITSISSDCIGTYGF